MRCFKDFALEALKVVKLEGGDEEAAFLGWKHLIDEIRKVGR